MFVRAYLRASTKEQDARRAKEELRRFAKERGLKIASGFPRHIGRLRRIVRGDSPRGFHRRFSRHRFGVIPDFRGRPSMPVFA